MMDSSYKTNLLATLPLDLLSDLLLFTRSTKDILAVARCSKYFCTTLTSPSATFIWKRARRFCFPRPMPNPPQFMTESAYASFVFDEGECEMCHRKTKSMYISFALKLRLCMNTTCRENFLLDFANGQKLLYLAPISLEIPRLESPQCIEYISDPECFLLDGFSVKDELSRHYCYREGTPEVSSDRDDSIKRRAIKRNDEWMKFCIKLNRWRFGYLKAMHNLKQHNRRIAATFAKDNGYNLNDLFNHTSYGKACRLRTKHFDKLAKDDKTAVLNIDMDLLTLAENRRRKDTEVIQSMIEAYYHRLRTETTGLILPPLTTFKQLPMIKSLLSLANREIVKSMQNLLELGIVDAELAKWEAEAKNQMAAVLGYTGWATAKKKLLHPVDRLTACFQCKKCVQAGRRYLDGACLDFAGACAHECEGRGSKDPGNELWSASNFVRDEKAIAAITEVFRLFKGDETRMRSFLEIRPPPPTTACWTIPGLYEYIRPNERSEILCTSCEPYAILAPKHVADHCHRHEAMQMKRLDSPGYERQVDLCRTYPLNQPSSGVESLVERRRREARLWNDANEFACRHCLYRAAEGTNINVEELSRGLKKMKLHGIRLHVKAKHGIREIGVEDVLIEEG